MKLIDTKPHLIYIQNPVPAGNAADHGCRQVLYRITQPFDHFVQAQECLVAESPLADLFPNLFYRVHLRGIRWDERKVDILRDLQSVRPVPPGPVTDQQQLIVRKCLCHLFQKHVHTDCVAVREHKKESVSRLRFHRPICVPVFPYMVTGYGWPHSSLAPAALRFVDPPEPCFILEQYSHSLLGKFFLQFVVSGFNFFEAFTASLSAAFGCLDLGIILRHPCRLSNR